MWTVHSPPDAAPALGFGAGAAAALPAIASDACSPCVAQPALSTTTAAKAATHTFFI
ncbi:MAG TPA: hypothetical protein VED01_10955 [Burkholderiales bacterium]|nr:hypothetical protein [Burkholderiales bacterium]